jgi:prepilin-type N-terminal cleavage/methylation domain-containing protein
MKTLHVRGFTLIELLVVIGILAVLLAITLVAINPQKQFQQANNTQRQSDVNAILNAINQYAVDNKGQLPAGITTSSQAISDTAADLCATLVPEYIAALPSDPLSASQGAPISDCGAAYDTEYTVVSNGNNRITIAAPNAEQGASISATR